jgi:hypothetical protein
MLFEFRTSHPLPLFAALGPGGSNHTKHLLGRLLSLPPYVPGLVVQRLSDNRGSRAHVHTVRPHHLPWPARPLPEEGALCDGGVNKVQMVVICSAGGSSTGAPSPLMATSTSSPACEANSFHSSYPRG